MPRYKIVVEYDGGAYVGWQRQANGLSVQEALECALAKLSGEKTTVQGAGRTDAGVHALGQVAHFDLAKKWPAGKLRDGLNFYLRPGRISILCAKGVGDDFHARFSARKRFYLYRILNRRSPPALLRSAVWHVGVPLDEKLMHKAAQALVGRHDFTTFRAAKCQAASPVRTLDAIEVLRIDDEIHIKVSARSFLHNQVRSITGSLKQVGQGRWSVDHMQKALTDCNRTSCGPVAPPQGLYLCSVQYPQDA